MAFIPRDAVWYIAQVVLEIIVEGEPQNLVHINYLLVRADSPEQAYGKALRLGAEHKTSYLNPANKMVRVYFRGLRNLTVLHEGLDDGAEILYGEKVGIGQEAVEALIRPKEALSVFKPIQRSSGPDYASAEIQREARKMVEEGG